MNEDMRLNKRLRKHFVNHLVNIQTNLKFSSNLSPFVNSEDEEIRFNNLDTGNEITLAVSFDSDYDEPNYEFKGEISGLVYAVVNGPDGKHVVLIDVTFVRLKQEPLANDFTKEFERVFTIKKIKNQIEFLLAIESTRVDPNSMKNKLRALRYSLLT